MKKKYVIFDMDGVLFDSERLIQRCWRQVGEQQGLADIGETFLQCVGTTRRHTRGVFQARYPECSYDRFQEACRSLFFGAIEKTGMPLKPGAAGDPGPPAGAGRGHRPGPAPPGGSWWSAS